MALNILNESSDEEESTDWMFETVEYLRKGDEVFNTDYELIGTVINGKIDFVNDDARDYHLGEKDESDESDMELEDDSDDTLELPDPVPETREISTQTDVFNHGSWDAPFYKKARPGAILAVRAFYKKLDENKKLKEIEDKPESDENVRDLQTKLNALQDAHDSLQAKHDEVVLKHAEKVRILKELAENPAIPDEPEEIEEGWGVAKPKPKKVKKKAKLMGKVVTDFEDTHEYRKYMIMRLTLKAGKAICSADDDMSWTGIKNKKGLVDYIWNYYETNVSGEPGQNQRWADDWEPYLRD